MEGLASTRIEASIGTIRLATSIATGGAARRASFLATGVASFATAQAAEQATERPVASPGTDTVRARIAWLINAFADPLGHGLVGRARLADAAGHVLVAGFHHILATGDAHLLHAGFLDALADLAAYFTMAALRHRSAYRAAYLAAMLLAKLLLHLAALRVAVLFIFRHAHRVMAVLVAGLRHTAAHHAFHILVAMLDAGTILHALDFLPTGPLHRTSAFVHLVAVLGDVAILVVRLAFFLVAGYLFVDRFADGLVAGMPPFLLDGVIDEFVANSILLLAGRIAVLRVAARIGTARETEKTTMRCRRGLSSSEQSSQGEQQRRSLAHLHDITPPQTAHGTGLSPIQTGRNSHNAAVCRLSPA